MISAHPLDTFWKLPYRHPLESPVLACYRDSFFQCCSRTDLCGLQTFFWNYLLLAFTEEKGVGVRLWPGCWLMECCHWFYECCHWFDVLCRSLRNPAQAPSVFAFQHVCAHPSSNNSNSPQELSLCQFGYLEQKPYATLSCHRTSSNNHGII